MGEAQVGGDDEAIKEPVSNNSEVIIVSNNEFVTESVPNNEMEPIMMMKL